MDYTAKAATAPLSSKAWVRFVPTNGFSGLKGVLTTDPTDLRGLPTDFERIVETVGCHELGVWVEDIGHIDRDDAFPFVAAIRRRLSEEEAT